MAHGLEFLAVSRLIQLSSVAITCAGITKPPERIRTQRMPPVTQIKCSFQKVCGCRQSVRASDCFLHSSNVIPKRGISEYPFDRFYASTQIPSPPVLHRTCSADPRRLARSSEQVVAPPQSCCPVQRSHGFANPDSRHASGRALFRSSFRCRASRSRCPGIVHEFGTASCKLGPPS